MRDDQTAGKHNSAGDLLRVLGRPQLRTSASFLVHFHGVKTPKPPLCISAIIALSGTNRRLAHVCLGRLSQRREFCCWLQHAAIAGVLLHGNRPWRLRLRLTYPASSPRACNNLLPCEPG